MALVRQRGLATVSISHVLRGASEEAGATAVLRFIALSRSHIVRMDVKVSIDTGRRLGRTASH